MENTKSAVKALHNLCLFRELLEHEVVKRLLSLFEENADNPAERYAAFINALFRHGDSFSDYLFARISESENAYITRAGAKPPSDYFDAALENDLTILEAVCALRAADIKAELSLPASLPEFKSEALPLGTLYRDRIKNVGKNGYGMWAKYHMFCVKDGKVVPVKYPDPQRLSDFSGYEDERNKVVVNTKALLEGKPCNNVLLYGDAGSGKSSTVKAIANEFKNEGLRLIEIKKHQLYSLPDIMDRISGNPLKFILFIDDLSFSRDDGDFGALKAILEGSVSGRSENLAIYATSNRRHLVKESFSDRDGDDLHFQDTVQELTSLSARFGLKVTFSKPGQKLYLDIVRDLAKQYGITMPDEELILKAEAHALRNGGRSPRTAKQFIETLSYTEGN